MANSSPTSVLFLCTEKSLENYPSHFNGILDGLRDEYKYSTKECKTLEEAKELLIPTDNEHRFHVILLHFHSSESALWKDAFHKTRAHNKYSEMIVVVVEPNSQNKAEAELALTGGCFAYFQYPFSPDVLFAYLEAARQKCENREMRASLSRELNDLDEITVGHVAEKIAAQLERLVEGASTTITLLKKDERHSQGYLRKQIYPELEPNISNNPKVKWFIKPTIENALVTRILSNDLNSIKRRVFPNIREDDELRGLFDSSFEIPDVKSLIVLPLQYAGNMIGVITLASSGREQFNYEGINEVVLEQVANQSAAALRYAEKDEVHQRLGEALSALNDSTNLEEILEKLAEQACRLVGGLFSYIVIPDQTQTRLEFRSGWSKHYNKRYKDKLEERIFFRDPTSGINYAGFPIPYDGRTAEKGITSLAFIKRRMQLLENITDKSYQEINPEAKNAYYAYPYQYEDVQGDLRKIDPSSDIALPILLKSKQSSNSPSVNEERVLGVINVEHQDPFAFTKEQIEALEQLAEFAAIAINNQENQKFISDLYDLSNFPYEDDLAFDKSIDSLNKFLDEVAETVKSVLKADLVSVHVVKDNKSFFIGKSNALDSVKEGSRWGNPETEGHTFWCVRNQKPVFIHNVKSYAESPSTYKDIFGESYVRTNNTPIEINKYVDLEKIRAVVCLPMITPGQRVVGVIWIHHQTHSAYSREKITLLQKFASHIANILDVVEKITFLKIENEIGTEVNKKDVLRKIVNYAKVYFGLRGAVIYEADHYSKELIVAESSFKEFSAIKKVRFNKESPDGLTGHLMLGENRGEYRYEEGIWHVSDYRKYVHAMEYTHDEKEKLGSLIGIRFPRDVPPDKAIGVLVIADAPVVPNEGGRMYNNSIGDLIRFADIAGRCLRAFQEESLGNFSSNTKPIPELQRRINELTISYTNELRNSEKKLLRERQLRESKELQLSELSANIENLRESVSESQQLEARLEKEKQEIFGKYNFMLLLLRWSLFVVLLILSSYPILYLDVFREWFSPGKGTVIAKLLAELSAISVLLLIPLWQFRKWLLGTALLGLVSIGLSLLPDILK